MRATRRRPSQMPPGSAIQGPMKLYKTTQSYFVGFIDGDLTQEDVTIRHLTRHFNPWPADDLVEQYLRERPEEWEVYYGGFYHSTFKTEARALRAAKTLVSGSWRKKKRKKQ